MRSKSEVRSALNSNFALDPEGDKCVPLVLPVEPAVAQPPDTPANNIHSSPNPNQRYRADAAPRPKPSNIRFAPNPNDCYRLAPRQIQLPALPGEREDGASIPLKGQYVAISDDDHDEIDAEDTDDLDDDPSLGLDDDLQTAMRKFAWAYAKGLGGLVMGVMDGFARVAGGDGGRTS